MLKRFVIMCLVVVWVVGIFTTVSFDTQAEKSEMSVYDMLSVLPMKNVSYSYIDNGTARNASVYFSPALLLQDSRKLSGEMAKASVALAMSAYSQSYVNNLLTGFGFTVYDNSSVYTRSAEHLTLDDNDYVAYTIAYRDVTHPGTGEKYRLYCVPVQGTTANAEWFSNFNLGKGTEHEGFRKASSEVYEKLQSYFATDGVDADHRVVWLTGHSRGAACANLISGWLSRSGETYTKAEHVFGYTYACPAVSLNADTTLTNIYNFNNVGDLIPMLPLKDWEYGRYGQTIALDTSSTQLSNVKLQFKATTNAVYAGEVSSANYQTLLNNILGNDRNVYYDSASLQTVLGTAAWALGGKNDSPNLWDVLGKYMDVPEVMGEVSLLTLKAAWVSLIGTFDSNDELAVWSYHAYNQTLEMSEEEFQTYLNTNASKIKQLEAASGVNITSVASFLTARNSLEMDKRSIRSLVDCVEAVMSLLTDEDGNVMDKITHGHAQSTYIAWINSLYYGYKGWYNNDAIGTMHIENGVISIGERAFYDCDGMTELTLPDTVVTLGQYAFGTCDGLRTVTLPVDYDSSQTPFGDGASDTSSHTTGVTTIYYTRGQTGIMPDRSDSSGASNSYQKTLEYISRNSIRSIDFDEGITHIGSCLFYEGSSYLKTMKFPSTLKTIGSYAFHNCDGLTKIAIPETLINIGKYAFYDCDGMTELTLPDAAVTLGQYAFASCNGLRTVTLPVDYDFTQSPFGYGDYYNDHFCTAGVTTIHYTRGQTGFMTDRSYLHNESNSYYKTLEYASRNSIQNIDFGEGVTHIGSHLFHGGSSSLKTVKQSSTIKTIGDYAFSNCTTLTNNNFNEGLVSVGEHAFSNCSKMNIKLVFQDRLTSIGSKAFENCDGMTELVIPDTLTSISNFAFMDCDGITTLTIPATVTSIGTQAFYDCDGMIELVLPDTAVTLGYCAFGGCDELDTVTLPVDYDISQSPFGEGSSNTSGVNTIHYTYGQTGVMTDRSYGSHRQALENASGSAIWSIDFEEGITHIGSYAFYENDLLTTVKLPSTLKTIGDYAFNDCPRLRDIDLNGRLVSVGNYAFSSCHNIKTKLVFQDSLISIGDNAFEHCDGLTEIILPESLTSIGSSAFWYCDGITKLTIPETMTSIGKYAFYDCDGMTELTLPDTAVTLGYYAFAGCDGLHTVTLPVDYDTAHSPFGYGTETNATTGVTTIHYTCGQTGFMKERSSYTRTLEYTSRNSIQSIVFAEGITNICNDLFRDGSSSLKTVKLPSTLKKIGSFAFYECTELTDINFSEGLVSVGSYAFCDCAKMNTQLVFKDSLTNIGYNAFYNCDGITKITLPETLTKINGGAFFDCDGMKELTLPDTVVALGEYAFGYCDGLRTVDLPVDYDISNEPFINTSGVTTIHYTRGQTGVMADRSDSSDVANYYQKALEYTSRNSIQSIDFARGITHIGSNLFYEGSTSLKTVALPSTLKTIGNFAFYQCTGSVEVTFCGEAPAISSNSFSKTTATCKYPSWAKTWTEEVKLSYGGSLTWVSDDGILTIQPTITLKYPSLSFEDVIIMNV